jgi:hypothetical protein
LAVAGGYLYVGGSYLSLGGTAGGYVAAVVEPALVDVPDQAPATSLVLGQNAPNPFTATTTIRFGLPASGSVTLRLYDVQGRTVAMPLDGARLEAGSHEVSLQRGSLAGGVYWYRLDWNGQTRTRRLVVID